MTQENLDSQEAKAKLLALAIESLEREFHTFLKDSSISMDEIVAKLENKDNFAEPIWEKLQVEKQKMDHQLDRIDGEVKDPKKLKKSFSALASVQQHWMFVR